MELKEISEFDWEAGIVYHPHTDKKSMYRKTWYENDLMMAIFYHPEYWKYPNQPQTVGQYKKDSNGVWKQFGEWKEYDSKQRLHNIYSYNESGKHDGDFYLYSNKKVILEGKYSNGDRIGDWKRWDKVKKEYEILNY